MQKVSKEESLIFVSNALRAVEGIKQEKDKGKIQNLIAQQQKNLAEVSYLELNSVANIINNFESSKLSEVNVKEKVPDQLAHLIV